MRYEDWDILLFERDSKVPIKEFKVACHVIHDAEFSPANGSFGLPTVCCFVPSLPVSTEFQISIHSWSAPSVSKFTRLYSKFVDDVTFEARLFIDGRLKASTCLERTSTWPHVIANSFEFSKTGDLESLKFPSFRQELLQQNYWSPADDLGRIKIVISEGFPRDSLTMPIERVKNVVAFSFQHAPLEILESSSIAWPNPSMWRRAPFSTSMPVPALPSNDADSHAHSPRRRGSGLSGASSALPMSLMQGIMSNTTPSDAGQTNQAAANIAARNSFAQPDPFGDANAYFEWLGGMGMGMGFGNTTHTNNKGHGSQPRATRKSNSDTSMPDYISSCHSGRMSAIHEQPGGTSGFRQDDDGTIGHWKVPTNTPTTGEHGFYDGDEGIPFPLLSHNAAIPPDLAHSLTNSLLNQPMPLPTQQHAMNAPATEVKSRKENRLQRRTDPSPSTRSSQSNAAQENHEMRRVSQQLFIPPDGDLPTCSTQQPTTAQPNGFSDLNQGATVEDHVASDIVATTPDLALSAVSGNSMDKGMKRARNFTPASAKAIDDEDEPRRVSPMVRLTPFVESDEKSKNT